MIRQGERGKGKGKRRKESPAAREVSSPITHHPSLALEGRRRFLKQGSGIVIGFILGSNGFLRALDARACGDEGDLDLNAWVHISNVQNTITVMCPTAEMGQGIYTSLPLLLAEELDADWRHIRVEQAPSDGAYINPEYFGVQGVGGSRSTMGYWKIMRLAGAQARFILMANAARSWGVPVSECSTVPSAVVHAASGRKMSYMDVGKLDDIKLDSPQFTEKDLKPPSRWRLIGRDVQRLDVPLKVNGSAKYGIDVHIPGMLYASILRPPVATCPHPLYGDGSENGPVKVDAAEAMQVEGVVKVVQLPHGVAVVGTDYWATVKGKRALKVEWRKGSLASQYDSEEKKREWTAIAADRSKQGRTIDNAGDFGEAMKGAAQTVAAEYVTDHVHHACMEPFNATAWMLHDDIEVWAPTQGQTWAQQSCARVTGLTPDKVRVHTTFLGGGFGAKTEQLANAEAAMLSKAVDKPVKVIWSREDDVKHGAYRPLTAQRMDAAISADGKVTGWSHRLVADSVLVRARKVVWDKSPGIDGSVAVGMTQPYGIPHKHHEYIHQLGGVPVGYWNAVGNGFTIFAVESFVDEIAAKLGRDPLQLRIDLMTDARGKVLLERVRKMSDWDRKREGRALGVAYNHGGRWNCQIAEVVEVSVERASGKITVHNVWAAADPGTAIQPRHLRQQLETGIIWGMSSGLRERVTIKGGEVQQSNFHDYPVPRMDEIPDVHIELVQGAVGQSSGAGQIGVAPMAPAIANAVYRLTGARLRSMPMLPERVQQALADAESTYA
jgi:isoquinoline 1-oxidoreductase beta subunit